jgi:uncharacterized membrane protein
MEQTTKTIVVTGEIGRIFNLWADFELFPMFMQHLRSVTKTGERTSHWVMTGPLGSELQWDATVTALEPNQRIAWQSTGGDIEAAGEVRFRQLIEQRTEITVTLGYSLPLRLAERVATRLLRRPETELEDDLENFRRYAETAEVKAGT